MKADPALMLCVAGAVAQLPIIALRLNGSLSASSDIPDMAAGEHSLLYGDFNKAYVIRDTTGVEVLRSDQLNMLSNQITFVGFFRTDGDVVDTNAVKHLRQLAT